MVKNLCVFFLSMQHSCWAIRHPSCGRGLGMGRAWEEPCSFSERCLGYVPARFQGRQLCPPWPQVMRLLSCSGDPTVSLTGCGKVSFHLGVPWCH